MVNKISFWKTPKGWAALGLIGAVSYFLIMEHGQHLFDWLPFLILFLCLFLHTFMHGSHGKHDTVKKDDNDEQNDSRHH